LTDSIGNNPSNLQQKGSKVGKKKENKDEPDKIADSEKYKQGDMELENGVWKQNQGAETFKFKSYKRQVTRTNERNAKIGEHNAKIDAKINLFRGMGFTFTYDSDKGILKDAVLEPGVSLEAGTAGDILFKTINSEDTYILRTNFAPWQQISDRTSGSSEPLIAPNAFAFLGKNSGAISNYAASHANKPQLQKMIAADAAEFMGITDHVRAAFILFGEGDPINYVDAKINFNRTGAQFLLYNKNNNGKFDVLEGKGKETLAY